ncbi:MAG: flavodoxin family protein [Planctomycetota bacterium]
MPAKILGISGSPIQNSNTDRAVKAALAAAGMDSEFIKLSELDVEPCRGCLACVSDNHCVVADDGQMLAEKFRAARAFILGTFTPYSSLDARSKAFMERMYCLRHLTGLNRGKIGAAVITTACDPDDPQLPPAASTTASQIAFWMLEEGMVNAGHMVLPGNVPCIRCGHGDRCPQSGIAMLHGPQATVASVGVRSFADDSGLLAAAEELGRRVAQMVSEWSTVDGIDGSPP